jgi:hypothetical protein
MNEIAMADHIQAAVQEKLATLGAQSVGTQPIAHA